MTSFIVISTDKNKRAIYVDNFLKSENIDKFDITRIGRETSKNQNSIGVEEIKSLQLKIFLKPIKSAQKAIIIEDADFLTIEAQNALLKALEEPPGDTIIILSSENVENILPTILSRCQIITLQSENPALSQTENREFAEFILSVHEMKIGDKLMKAENLAKDKDKAIEWVGKIVLCLREEMLKKGSSAEKEIAQIKEFQKLYIILKTTNVNPRFAIENTLLSI